MFFSVVVVDVMVIVVDIVVVVAVAVVVVVAVIFTLNRSAFVCALTLPVVGGNKKKETNRFEIFHLAGYTYGIPFSGSTPLLWRRVSSGYPETGPRF